MYPADASGLTYTVKVPVMATGSGSGCLTATVRALPPEITSSSGSAYDKAQDNTAKACVGAPREGDPELPVLFQSGRADLVTLHKCADGTSFPCAGKSADDLVQYVRAADDDFEGAPGPADSENLANVGSGNAAENAGSPYRAFRPGDVVTHVPDLNADGGRRVRVNALPNNLPTGDRSKYPANRPAWYTAHDLADRPGDSNDFGHLATFTNYLKGVAVKYRFLGADYDRWAMSLCAKRDANYLTDATDTTPCDSTATDTNPALMRALWWKSWTFELMDMADTQPTSNFTRAHLYPGNMVFEFSTLGTYHADIIIATDYVNTPAPTADTVKAVGRHTFHVGPAADLRVYPGGASSSVVSGKRTFTIVAESEATREIDAEIIVSTGIHTHREQINLRTLIPAVTVTAGGAAIPEANVSQVGATAGAYDTATGVWTLPEGFQGHATLTLVADASAVSSVKAKIANSAEVCENAAGTAQATVDGRAAVSRATCEFNKDGAASGNHWGAYQRCFNTSAGAVGLDPDSVVISGETACTTNAATNTWHTTEVYDWRPNNNEVTFTPDAAGFTLNARGAGRTSIDLRWAKQSGADDYAIYSVSTADLTSTDNLGALLSVNQIAVVPGDVTTYYHDGLAMGEKRRYLVRARQDGRPMSISQLAGATAEIPGEPWQAPRDSRAPGAVGSLKAVRKSDDATTINVSWNAPSSGATGYDVQYRSRLGGSGSYSNWTSLSAEQAGTTYTFHNAGGGTSYQFQVRAVNVFGGQTNYSGWSTSNTVSPVSNPDRVGSLTATRQFADETKIDVSWTAPTSGANSTTTYDIERREDGGAWGNQVTGHTATLVNGKIPYQLTGAVGAKSYQFRVRAVTIVGGDTITASWQTSNTVPRVTTPGQVSSLQADRVATDDRKIDVTWTAPSNATGATKYDIQYKKDNDSDWTSAATGHAASPYQLTGATGVSRYVFQVRAVTRSDGSDLTGSWRTSNTVPVLGAPNQVGTVTATRQFGDETKIDVSWTAPGSGTAPTGYHVQHRVNGTGDWLPDTPTDHTDAAVNGKFKYTLDNNVSGNNRYQFRVRGYKTLQSLEKVAGSWRSSNTVPAVPPPGQVTGLTATRQSDETKIDVTRTPPSNATGATKYDVEYKQDNASDWHPATPTSVAAGTTTYTLNGAAGGSRYVFRVRGVTTLTGGGNPLEGSWRQSSVVRGLPAGNIGSVTATRQSDATKILVTWTASNRATGYDVQYRKNNGGWSSAATKQTGLSHTQTNAGGVETYQFRVRGVSDAGNGAWTVSDTVDPPPVGWHGADVGVDWFTLKVTSGPWWFDYRDHKADWSSCRRVASGSHTLTNLRPNVTYLVDVYTSSGCSANKIVERANVATKSDVYDWGECWNTDDCRSIDRPDDFSYHTHKRSRLAEFAVTISGCDYSTRHHHDHTWPDGRGGYHWHCKTE